MLIYYQQHHCGKLHDIWFLMLTIVMWVKKVREKSREWHNHKPQPFPDPKRKRKPTNLNKHKPNKRTKSTKFSSLFPKRGNRSTKRTEKHKNKMIHGKTYNKSPRRINHKATKSKTNINTRAVKITYVRFKLLYGHNTEQYILKWERQRFGGFTANKQYHIYLKIGDGHHKKWKSRQDASKLNFWSC